MISINHHDSYSIRQCLSNWSTDLVVLWQNNLLNESSFIKFAKDRGLAVFGAVTGDPGNLHKRGWLTADSLDSKGEPLFHPFRFYVVHKILDLCKLRIAPSASLNRDTLLDLVQHSLPLLPSVDEIGQATQKTAEIVDLVVLLEPVYWPDITSWLSRRLIAGNLYVTEEDFDTRLDQYRSKVCGLVANLDPKSWRETHKRMRIDAALLDENKELYVLLRLANWKQREKVTGALSGALWIRHIAEIIRRAFEEIHGEHWQEEDEAFGTWFVGGRKLVFGSDRPLDNKTEARSTITVHYGLNTGSAVRWYVEGATEYYAVLEIIPDPSKFGIEILNLRGNLASERDNAALKLSEWLIEDKTQKRFSIVSFDTDVSANVKAIQRQVKMGRIVGVIGAHKPDFEFANFTIEELVEIAATLDEGHGVSGDAVRNAVWNSVLNMREFETRYKFASARSPASLKGEEWGRALAKYAIKHPTRSDNGLKRTFWEEIEKAVRCRSANYNVEEEYWEFDPVTFQPITRNAESKKD
jgi:hypothetical protein